VLQPQSTYQCGTSKAKTQKEVALAQQQQALLEFKKTLLIAGSEVSNALFTFESETKKFEFRKNEVEESYNN
tara:strand:+ start:487 stop:702 length:216 start_codon:yes stop_codon:yes gene_type:complete